jgi:hypothetical protein
MQFRPMLASKTASERCWLARIRNNIMSIVGILVVASAAVSVIGVVTAHRLDTQYDGMAAALVENKGNLLVPFGYRNTCETLDGWTVAKNVSSGRKSANIALHHNEPTSEHAGTAYGAGRHSPGSRIAYVQARKSGWIYTNGYPALNRQAEVQLR